jgi:hypothetical protein
VVLRSSLNSSADVVRLFAVESNWRVESKQELWEL